MKNILLITTMYPTPNSEGHTPVCHYFARDWRKMGYNVIVIHFKSVFPIVFYKLATQFRRLAIKVVGNDNVDIKRASNDISFIQDDVSIYSFPIFKFIPHGKYNNKVLLTQINKIVSLLELERFIPDII
ncbi:MAG: hypothetical protein HQ521_14395, partial [Bacteroidetes bacterium]|nr:hypothetical protein [Bacteroidota bacterium]